MEVLYPRCAGLDVHQASVVACMRIAAGARAAREVRTFESTTRGLLALADWLREAGCTHVAMESTGVYWKPVWHVLEGEFELLLANATHIRNVPGRKTDVNDAMWIADLLAHGLIKSSFVPPIAVQELRDLTRTRKQLVRELARHVQRLQKTLEDANIKIAGVISDILGVSGRAFLDAIIAGETDPEQLAALTRSRLRASREQLVEALRGQVRAHHRFMLKLHLQQVKSLEQAISEIEARLGECLEPFREEVKLLTTMPGISQTAAHVMAAEMGVDMQRFSGAESLVSWAGMCPRSDESAGKRRSTRVRKGAPLVEDHPHPGGMGGEPHQEYLSARVVSSTQSPPRRDEGDRRGRRVNASLRLLHADPTPGVSRSRPRSFRPPHPHPNCQPPAQTPQGPRRRSD
jgi:transposase